MPKFRNIEIEFLLPSAVSTLPEFPPPSNNASASQGPFSDASTLDSSIILAYPVLVQGSTITVYIPTYPQAAFWIKYEIHSPEPEIAYFMQCFLNGRPMQSWGFGSECDYKGKMMYTMWDKKEPGAMEKRAMCFGPEEPAMALETNERVIEIKVYRASACEAIDEPTVTFHETEFYKKGLGNFFPERDEEEGGFDEHNEETRALGQVIPEKIGADTRRKGGASRGLDEGIRLVKTGNVKASTSRKVEPHTEDVPTTGRYFRWLLKDRIDEPLATFHYYYRTWEQLNEMGVYAPLACPSRSQSVGDLRSPQQRSSFVSGVDEDSDSFFSSPTEDVEHPDRFVLNEPGRGLTVRHANVTPTKKQNLGKKPLPPLPPIPDSDDISPILGGFKEAIKRNHSPSRAPHLPPRTSSLLGRILSPTSSRSGPSGDDIALNDSPSSFEDQRHVPVSEFRDIVSRRSVEDVRGRRPLQNSYLKSYNLPAPPPVPPKDEQQSRSKSKNRFLFRSRSKEDTDNGIGGRLPAQVRTPYQPLVRKSDVTASPKAALSSAEDRLASPKASLSSAEGEPARDNDSPTPPPRRRNRKKSPYPRNSAEAKRDQTPLPRKPVSISERQARVPTTAKGAARQGLFIGSPTPSLLDADTLVGSDSASTSSHLNSSEISRIMRSPSMQLDQLSLHGREAIETAEGSESTKSRRIKQPRLQLPIGWQQGTTKSGIIFFQDCIREITSVVVPSGTLLPVKPHSENPDGWEIRYTADTGRVWFMNLFTQQSTFDWPDGAVIGGLGNLRPGWEGQIAKDGRIIFVNYTGVVEKYSYNKPGYQRRFREESPPPPVPEIPERFRHLITPATKPKIYPKSFATPLLPQNRSAMMSPPPPQIAVHAISQTNRLPLFEDTPDIVSERSDSPTPSESSDMTATLDFHPETSGRTSHASQRSDDSSSVSQGSSVGSHGSDEPILAGRTNMLKPRRVRSMTQVKEMLGMSKAKGAWKKSG